MAITNNLKICSDNLYTIHSGVKKARTEKFTTSAYCVKVPMNQYLKFVSFSEYFGTSHLQIQCLSLSVKK